MSNTNPYDPYAPPRHDPYQGGGGGGGQYGASPGYLHYEPLGWKTMASQVGIIANVVLGLIVAVLPYTISGDPAQNLGAVAAIGLVGLLSGAISLGTIIVYLLWTHQAAKNIRAFGQQMLEFTPGWAVGWWFIPFANYWFPYKVLREIWKASDPESVGANSNGGTAWSSRPVGSLFPLWWATYLINGFIGGAAAVKQVMVSFENPGKPNLTTSPLVLVAHFFLIIAAVAIVSIMSQLARRQEASYLKLRG
jgi:hypothetical protein